jgi:exosortase
MNLKLRNTQVARRNAGFAFLVFFASVISWRSLLAAAVAAFHNDQYSHILLVLPVSVTLLFLERRKVFRNMAYCLPAGLVLFLLAMAFLWVARYPLVLGQNDTLSLRMVFFVGWCVTAFVLCYGIPAFRIAPFPLLFLFLMVPIPELVLERTIGLLQSGSTDMTFLMLKAANVPVLRKGFVLSLPGIDIEVAKECSGIRSSLMLFTVGLVLVQLFLHTAWRKGVVLLLLFPMAVAKNSVRIFTLSTLGIYVDPSFLNGDLHQKGGIVFFAVAVGALMLVIWFLRTTEKKTAKERSPQYP